MVQMQVRQLRNETTPTGSENTPVYKQELYGQQMHEKGWKE
jgi:hypothetical protein